MVRLELMANQSVHEEVIKVFEYHRGTRYTWIPSVQGRGSKDWKLGNADWPEENFLLISYLEETAAGSILIELDQLKAAYPREGISYFALAGATCLSQEL